MARLRVNGAPVGAIGAFCRFSSVGFGARFSWAWGALEKKTRDTSTPATARSIRIFAPPWLQTASAFGSRISSPYSYRKDSTGCSFDAAAEG